MEQVGIAALKARLSHYIAVAKTGEEVIISERGQPVARLVPLQSGDLGTDHLREMEKRGECRIGTGGVPASLGVRPRPRQSVLQALLDERRESSR